jgi:tetratricopeptide (TPR) repeat protein
MNSRNTLLMGVGLAAAAIVFFVASSLMGVDVTKTGAQNGGQGLAVVGIALLAGMVAMMIAAPYVRRADRSELAVGLRVLEKTAALQDPRYEAFGRARSLYLHYLRDHGIDTRPAAMPGWEREAACEDAGLREAERLFKVARDGAITSGAQTNAAVAWYQLGMLYQLQERLDEAAQALRAALTILRDLPQLGSSDQETQSNAHFALGEVAMEQNKREEAQREFQAALAIDIARHDLQAQAQTQAALTRLG